MPSLYPGLSLGRRSVLVMALAGSRAHLAWHCGCSCPVPSQSWCLVLWDLAFHFVFLFIMFSSCLLHREHLSMAQNSESVQCKVLFAPVPQPPRSPPETQHLEPLGASACVGRYTRASVHTSPLTAPTVSQNRVVAYALHIIFSLALFA